MRAETNHPGTARPAPNGSRFTPRGGTMMRNADAIQRVFKITTRDAWEAACDLGTLPASDDDRRDGFIHLSSPHQIAGTLAKHFKDQADLVLIEFDTEMLGDDLRWEPSRGGDLFPHLYASLPTAAARAAHALQLNSKGVPVVPEDITEC